jgi:hypothetical protein
LPFEHMLHGSIAVCTDCLHGDPSKSPLWPSSYIRRHEAWHTGQARNGPELLRLPPDDPGGEEPVLECAS